MNPFTFNPKYHFFLVYENLKDKNVKALDLGFGDGELIKHLKGKINSVYGYDVNKKSVVEVQKKYEFANIRYGKVGYPLPYRSNYFDIVFLLHVLEHVDDEERILREIYRVLKNDGTLYLAAPYRGLFTWLDTANLRYNFPFVHRFLGGVFYGRKKFTELFERSERSLFGDSSRQRNSHYHYKEGEIKELLSEQFRVEKFYKYSLFQPFLFSLWNVWVLLFGKVPAWLKRMVWWDNHLGAGEFSYNFFVVARKK